MDDTKFMKKNGSELFVRQKGEGIKIIVKTRIGIHSCTQIKVTYCFSEYARSGTFSFFGRRKKELELANSDNSRVQGSWVSSTH